MECCVEDTHLGQSWHQFLHGVHTLQVSGIMQWSQIRALLECLEHLVSKNHRLVELLATVHHTVTHSINLAEVFYNTDFRVGKQREDELHALCMLGDVVHYLLFLTVSELYFHESAVESHALSAAAGHHTLVVHIVQCVLY